MPGESRFQQLARENLLTPSTLAALAAREPVLEGEPRFLSPEAFGTLVALCDRLRPPYDRPTAREIALRIDARLAGGESDGWRYDTMPPDREAHARGLAALAVEGPLDDDLIRRLQRGETRAEWSVPPDRFVEEVLAEIVTFAYSHPAVQDEIGYVGYADAKGWSHIRIEDDKEPWE